VLQKTVESPLSVSMLSGQFAEGDKVMVDLDEENRNWYFTRRQYNKGQSQKSVVTFAIEWLPS